MTEKSEGRQEDGLKNKFCRKCWGRLPHRKNPETGNWECTYCPEREAFEKKHSKRHND